MALTETNCKAETTSSNRPCKRPKAWRKDAQGNNVARKQGCYQHQDQRSHGVYVRKSQIPNAGLGLFTRRPIEKKQTIIPYGGYEVTPSDYTRRRKNAADSRYVVRRSNHTFVDAEDSSRSNAARYVNELKPRQRAGDQRSNNAKITEDKSGKLELEATKDIAPKKEILVDYKATGEEDFEIDDRIVKRGNVQRARERIEKLNRELEHIKHNPPSNYNKRYAELRSRIQKLKQVK